MITAQAEHKSGFYIGVTCPGCGAILELQEDYFVIKCDFCKSVLKIDMPETPPAYLIKGELSQQKIRFQIDRYLKKNNLPLTKSNLEIKPIYFPYWKINGIILKVRNKSIELFSGQTDDEGNSISYERDISDIRLSPYIKTVAANENFTNIPHTIGMRTDYIRLDTFSRENIADGFRVIPILKNWESILDEMDGTIEAIGSLNQPDFGDNLTELFNPDGSLVYFPYYIVESEYGEINRRFIIDGKSGTVAGYSEKPIFDEDSFIEEQSNFEFGELKVDFHRCGNCGIDLPEIQSAIYICPNCHVTVNLDWKAPDIGEIKMINGTVHPNDIMFPFWSMLMSEEDKKALGPMFGGIYGSDRLIIPAFKMVNFEAMYRLTKRFSSAIRTLDLISVNENLNDKFHPVTLGVSDALLMAEILIRREYVGKGIDDGSEFFPDDFELFYAPFHAESYFYVDSILNAITFEKKLKN
ncbi:MAG: hypothetical protein ABIJ45_00230 [Candidatus Zixiibacteriota bacterium]